MWYRYRYTNHNRPTVGLHSLHSCWCKKMDATVNRSKDKIEAELCFSRQVTLPHDEYYADIPFGTPSSYISCCAKVCVDLSGLGLMQSACDFVSDIHVLQFRRRACFGFSLSSLYYARLKIY